MPILEKLERPELQRIAKTIADVRYDVLLDGRASNDDLIEYIKKYAPSFTIDDERIDLVITLPPNVNRVVYYAQKKRGRKPTK